MTFKLIEIISDGQRRKSINEQTKPEDGHTKIKKDEDSVKLDKKRRRRLITIQENLSR